MPLHPLLQELLMCPQCSGELEARADGLFCAQSGLLYPVRDGIPVMLIEEATKLSADVKTSQLQQRVGEPAGETA